MTEKRAGQRPVLQEQDREQGCPRHRKAAASLDCARDESRRTPNQKGMSSSEISGPGEGATSSE